MPFSPSFSVTPSGAAPVSLPPSYTSAPEVAVKAIGHPFMTGGNRQWVLLKYRDGTEQYMLINEVARQYPRELLDFIVPRLRAAPTEAPSISTRPKVNHQPANWTPPSYFYVLS